MGRRIELVELTDLNKGQFIVIPDPPWFVAPFGDTDQEHTYKGSLLRHITVERVLYRFNWFLFGVIGETCPLFHVLLGLQDVLFGLNCNFPLRNIALFAAWSMHLFDPFKKEATSWRR